MSNGSVYARADGNGGKQLCVAQPENDVLIFDLSPAKRIHLAMDLLEGIHNHVEGEDIHLMNAICNAADQGHRAAHHNARHPISNVYSKGDYGGKTYKAWQIGYDKERRRIEQDRVRGV